MRYSIVPYTMIFLISFLLLYIHLVTLSFGSILVISVVSFMNASTITFVIFAVTTVLQKAH